MLTNRTFWLRVTGLPVFLLCFLTLCAQTSRLDSLRAELAGATGTRRADVLNDITKLYIGIDTARAFHYNAQARKTSDSLNYKKGIATAYNNLGTIYYYLSQYTSDTIYQHKALAIFTAIRDSAGIARSYANLGLAAYAQSQYEAALGHHKKALGIRLARKDREGIADSYSSMGIVYYYQGDYSSALEYQRQALDIRESLNDQRGIALSNNHLGNIYKSLSNNEKALEYFQNSLRIYEKLADKLGIAISSNNIAGIYAERNQNEKALQYYNRSLGVYKDLGNYHNIVLTYNYLGKVYENLGNVLKAREFYSQALVESIKIGNIRSKAISYNNLGALDYKEKRYAMAIYNLERASAIAEQAGIKDELRSAYLFLAKSLAATGDYQKAYNYHLKYSMLQDDLRKIDIDKISDLEVQVIREKKDKELRIAEEREEKQEAEIKKQKVIKYSFIIGSFLMLGFLVVIYNRLRFIRKQKSIIEAERERSDNLLLNILPADVAAELKEKGKSTARSYERVTVMFTDIENFTRIGEKLSPEKLVDEIDYYFKGFDHIIQKHGIEKIKTIGDAYMCAGGLHNTSPSASDVVKAALEIQEFMEKTRAERISRNEPFFQIRIGIHTGPVVAGIVGFKKFAYDIWGDAVNTAARMETSSETGRINISGATYQLIRDEFNCIYRGKIEVKNKGVLDMYFVEGIRQGHDRRASFDRAKDYILQRLAAELPPNLYYHGLHHTMDVLRVATQIGEAEKLPAEELEILKLAALYHDSGFITTYHGHEEAGCELARGSLQTFGYSAEQINRVCELIMSTKVPQRPQNHLEKILCDADLDYLGRGDYNAISNSLYNELKEYGYRGDRQDWKEKQESFLENHNYFLDSYRDREQGKNENLQRLKNTQSQNIKPTVMSTHKADLYLVPTDFSEVAECAINHAAESARVTKSEVMLIHVVDSSDKNLGFNVQDKLAEQARDIERKYGVKADFIAREGSIFDTIGEVAVELHAKLIFMGTHGVVGLQQKLLGAFALRVINTSPAPVVVVQKKKMASNGYDTIVYPMDSTRESKQKMNDTLAIAKSFDAEVHIFAYPESDEFLSNAVKRNVNHAKKYLTENNIRFQYAEANPKDHDNYNKQMLRYASQVNADLIVIMSRTEKGIKEFIIGPDEERIINNDSQIPVMCVNPVDHNMVTDSIVY